MALPYVVKPKDGTFYAPKIDIYIDDALGREWQMATLQVDLTMLPERFDLTYTAEDGSEQRPMAIHRAIYGSLERFIGILVEHFGGAFPLWLAPVQAVVIPIADRHIEAADELAGVLRARGLRVDVDGSSNRMQYKIRTAQEQKVPYMVVLGDRRDRSPDGVADGRGQGSSRRPSDWELFADRLAAECRRPRGRLIQARAAWLAGYGARAALNIRRSAIPIRSARRMSGLTEVRQSASPRGNDRASTVRALHGRCRDGSRRGRAARWLRKRGIDDRVAARHAFASDHAPALTVGRFASDDARGDMGRARRPTPTPARRGRRPIASNRAASTTSRGKKPADDQRCGAWTGDATIEGLPAHCTATLYWLEMDGETYVFLAERHSEDPGIGRSRIRTSRSMTSRTAGTRSAPG